MLKKCGSAWPTHSMIGLNNPPISTYFPKAGQRPVSQAVYKKLAPKSLTVKLIFWNNFLWDRTVWKARNVADSWIINKKKNTQRNKFWVIPIPWLPSMVEREATPSYIPTIGSLFCSGSVPNLSQCPPIPHVSLMTYTCVLVQLMLCLMHRYPPSLCTHRFPDNYILISTYYNL